MVKKVLKSSFIGTGAAVIISSIVMMIIDIANGGSLDFQNYQYTKMFFGDLIVGLGFGIPSLIYENENIPYPIQIVFHMGIGCAVMLVVAFSVGWIPSGGGAPVIILSVAGEIAVAFLIRKVILLHYKKEAEQINRKLKAKHE
ncbi:MAG: DUF3021 domain-containing protein [Lachnospiraceae bacterium]|jgi:hypothetical protein|nr:DUF3021 domain-containing protein [Lachnospiraceae bacterium]MCH4027926.1 DUF3021 domain-containing protein [Lachnospiraceae bacterium]MCH4065770.1 DUF3021 domain-containing protein [Lachnospiraceae bacterium]MCH4111806.1 DUF3021 domain-containing protein [Lachnospiraceae bacterium]